MLAYLVFILRYPFFRHTFQKLSPFERADYLEKHHLYFEAGKQFMKLKDYASAGHCFLKCDASRHLIQSYLKQGLVSDALEVAKKNKLYKLGAQISMKHHNLNQAAYFYSFFDPLQGAKLYKKLDNYLEAGFCYLSLSHYTLAAQCFRQCQKESERTKGHMALEEVAITLYLRKHYLESFRIFIELRDYNSAYLCAKKLNDPLLLSEMDAIKPELALAL